MTCMQNVNKEGRDDKITVFLRPELVSVVKDGKGGVQEYIVEGYDRSAFKDGTVIIPAYGVKGVQMKQLKDSERFKDWYVLKADKDAKLPAKEIFVEENGFEANVGAKISVSDLKAFASTQNRKLEAKTVLREQASQERRTDYGR